MNTPEELGQYLQQLIDRNREDLSILLQTNGIDDTPTPMLLVKLYELHGDDFVAMMAQLGDDAYADMPALSHAEGLFAKVGELFSKAKSVVTGVKAIAGGGSSSQAPASDTPPPPADDKKITTKKIFIIGGIVVVVLTIIVIIVKRSKKK